MAGAVAAGRAADGPGRAAGYLAPHSEAIMSDGAALSAVVSAAITTGTVQGERT